jgi:hypothetical protein
MLHRKMMSRKRYLAASLGSPGQWGVTAIRARLLANVTAFMKRQPGFNLDPGSSRDRRKSDLLELCGLGIDR